MTTSIWTRVFSNELTGKPARAATVVLSALLLGASPAGAAGEGNAAATVGMTDDLSFEPETVTIEAGQTVLWENTSGMIHTVTADPEKAADPDHVELPEGAEPFDSGNIAAGESFSYTFETPGHYTYFCIPHEAAGMIGHVVVE